MHELSVALALRRACRAELGETSGARLARVEVAVGELSGVEPELLALAWEAVVAGTLDAGAELSILSPQVAQRCAACGPIAERRPGTWLRTCPHCGEPLALCGGDELEVRALEVLEPSPEPHEVSP